MKKIALLLILSLATSVCVAKLPPEYRKYKDRILVQGVSENGVSVLIRKVNDSEILFVKGYNLGDKVWLEKGDYKLSVTFMITRSWGQKIESTDVDISVEEGAAYKLHGTYENEVTSVVVEKVEKK